MNGVTRPANVASAGPVIKVMARLRLCRGPELNRRHMVLQIMRQGIERAGYLSGLVPLRSLF